MFNVVGSRPEENLEIYGTTLEELVDCIVVGHESLLELRCGEAIKGCVSLEKILRGCNHDIDTNSEGGVYEAHNK